MSRKSAMVVREYIDQLKETKKGKPQQIKEALDIYLGLWDKVIENGTILEKDEVSAALAKLDQAGGLYVAADI